MELSDARKFLRIDQSFLIVECATHAQHQEEVHRQFAYACSRRDEAKIALDTAIAGVSEELRNQKDDNGKSYTGERIAFLIQADSVVAERRTEVNRLTQETELWRAIVNAMESRRRMLSDLTALTLQGMSGGVKAAVLGLENGGSAPYRIARRVIGAAREERSQQSST